MKTDTPKKSINQRQRVLFIDAPYPGASSLDVKTILPQQLGFEQTQVHSIEQAIQAVGKGLAIGQAYCLVCLYAPPNPNKTWLRDLQILSEVSIGADVLLLKPSQSPPVSKIPGLEELQQRLVIVDEMLNPQELNRLIHVLLASWSSRARGLKGDSQFTYEDALREIDHLRDQLSHAQIFAKREGMLKHQILMNVSHEFRTPMHAIMGYLEVLESHIQSQEMPEQCRQAVTRMRVNGDKLLEVVGKVLQVSDLDNGEFKDLHTPFDIRKIMCVESHRFEQLLLSKGVAFDLDIASDVPQTLKGDSLRIIQIIRELTDNATKFTKTGSVSIGIWFETDNTLAIEVRDTGVGISTQDIDQIFQPFYQVDGSLTRLEGGMGLGMSHCRMNVKLLGGHISVDSAVGKGSVFLVKLPIALADDSPQNTQDHTALAKPIPMTEAAPQSTHNQKTDTPTQALTPKTHGKKAPTSGFINFQSLDYRVLLVEDGLDNQKLISLFLRKADVAVDIAENGQVGVNMVEKSIESGEPYHLILMDMQMPVMDGYQATQYLREQGVDLPIVAITAHALAGDREKCLQAGCNDYATKPLKRVHLLDIVKRYAGS